MLILFFAVLVCTANILNHNNNYVLHKGDQFNFVLIVTLQYGSEDNTTGCGSTDREFGTNDGKSI